MINVRGRHRQQIEVEESLAILRAADGVQKQTVPEARHALLTGQRWISYALTSYSLPVAISIAAGAGLAVVLLWSPEPSTEPRSAPSLSAGAAAPAGSVSESAVARTALPSSEPAPQAQQVLQPLPPSSTLAVAIPAIRGMDRAASQDWPAPPNRAPVSSGGPAALVPEASAEAPKNTDAVPTPQQRLSAPEAAVLGRRADALLSSGDLPAARLILRLLAENRDARAAYLLGRTFDPAFLAQSRTIGIQGDPAKARRWYEVARSLGYSEAARSLQDISAQTVGGR
jgi:hypothetical protein